MCTGRARKKTEFSLHFIIIKLNEFLKKKNLQCNFQLNFFNILNIQEYSMIFLFKRMRSFIFVVNSF